MKREEQLAISDVTKRNVGQEEKSANKNIAHCFRSLINSLFPLPFSLLFSLFLGLLILSCELFTGPKVDLFQVISDEVDWANAPKLSVRVEHPAAWGISNPTGTITPAKDIRKGYAFEIEYTPDLAYSLAGWRAYATSSLPANWVLDTSLLDNLERLDGVSVEIPDLPARGGTGSFIINTAEPVTLVPWCKTEPYVTRTIPRDSPNMLYPRGTDIVIYFNAPLNLTQGEVDLFTTGAIKITGGGDDFSAYYNRPVYDANNDLGEYKITISPSDVPGDALIEVTVGPKIYNAAGEPMSKPEVFSFKTASSTLSGSITEWSASYNGSAITVGWTAEGAVDVAARYRVNQGGDNALSGGSPAVIRGVSQPNVSDVRNGTGVSGIREYEIFLDLYIGGIKSNAGSVSFKIWNIPDMNITHNNTVLLDNDNFSAALVAAGSSGENFILTEDIEIDSWTPAGTSASPFSGRFYGNGHTVTISGMNAAAGMGLFGTVDGGIVRDLTVNYSSVTVSPTGAARFGGIAANAAGGASLFENVLVKGAFTLNGDNTIFAGGIAGLMTGTAKVFNAHGGLNLTVNKTGTDGSIYTGGIAGSVGGVETGSAVTAEQMRVIGDITVGDSGPVDVQLLEDYYTGLYVGGLVGFIRGAGLGSSQAVLKNSDYRQGTISVRNGIGYAEIGGAVGHLYEYVTVTGCSSAAGKIEISKEGAGNGIEAEFFVGGFLGDTYYNTQIEDCFSVSPIVMNNNSTANVDIFLGGFAGSTRNNVAYCYAIGNVSVFSIRYVSVGGFAGQLSNGSNTKFCYAIGNVSVISRTANYGLVNAGGFSGYSGGASDCYALGDVFVNASGSIDISAGSFEGCEFSNNSAQRQRCFATGNVVVERSISGTINIGGLSGQVFSLGLQNSVSLGASVTATGPGTKNIGRVYGGGSTANKSNNHAFNAMRLYEHGTYQYPWPTEITAPGYSGSVTLNKTHDGKDGLDAGLGTFRTRSFWTNPPPASGVPFNIANHGLGFSSTVTTTINGITANYPAWDFSTVEGRGYPRLRNRDGSVMGGQ